VAFNPLAAREVQGVQASSGNRQHEYRQCQQFRHDAGMGQNE
jgi:hypothetical protein